MSSQDDASRRPADRQNSPRGSVRERLSGKPSPPVPWWVEGAPRQTPSGRRPEDKERTAFHESGHALLGLLTTEPAPGLPVSDDEGVAVRTRFVGHESF